MLSRSEIKYIQSLSDSKWAMDEGVYVVEGKKIVAEYLDEAPQRIRAIYALSEWNAASYVIPSQIKLHIISSQEMKKISFLSTPGEVIALISMQRIDLCELQDKGLTLYLDQIQDPGNLGTIIRSCDWFGVHQIVCSPGTVSPYNPKVLQSSMGSDKRVMIVQADHDKFFGKFRDLPVFAAVLGGKSIYAISPPKDAVIVIGNESRGISKEVLKHCSEMITIPRIGMAESLNAALATAIILSQFQSKLI